ncbi:MAG: barstar family protein [Betaproteobacteria bacterium]|nr:barstar family protein [Betaproteobacteria bacterium]MCL2886443.1 barstar family protein [Betaproteobacteria bacterium]
MNTPLARRLADTHQAGLYHMPELPWAVLAQAAARAGLRILAVDFSACRSKAAMLAELGRACAFPEWHGGNLDALLDGLCDPGWQAGANHLLLLTGVANLHRAAPGGLAGLREVLAAACDERREAGRPLWALLDAPTAGVADFPTP